MSWFDIATTVFMFIVFFGAVLGAVLYWIFGRTPRYPVLKRVIVTTRNDQSYRGLLWQRHADFLVLKDAELLRERADPVKMAGELMIYSAHVEYLQVLPAAEL